MEFNSAITLLRDADAQSNELFVFPGQGTVLQGIGFEIFKFPKRADPAAKHGLIVLLAGFSYFTDLIEHGVLQKVGFNRNAVCLIASESSPSFFPSPLVRGRGRGEGADSKNQQLSFGSVDYTEKALVCQERHGMPKTD